MERQREEELLRAQPHIAPLVAALHTQATHRVMSYTSSAPAAPR